LVYLCLVSKLIYIILFWEFYFLPLSVHPQTNTIYETCYGGLYNNCINFFINILHFSFSLSYTHFCLTVPRSSWLPVLNLVVDERIMTGQSYWTLHFTDPHYVIPTAAYAVMYSWWWAWWMPETCKSSWNKSQDTVACHWIYLYICCWYCSIHTICYQAYQELPWFGTTRIQLKWFTFIVRGLYNQKLYFLPENFSLGIGPLISDKLEDSGLLGCAASLGKWSLTFQMIVLLSSWRVQGSWKNVGPRLSNNTV
jgi:hypothetical protein